MGQISVTLNNRTYRLRCDEGEESRLVELADYFSKKVESIKDDVGEVGDDRLYVMAALTVVDELWDSRKQNADLNAQLDNLQRTGPAAAMPSKELVENIEAAAEKIENLKDQLVRGASIQD